MNEVPVNGKARYMSITRFEEAKAALEPALGSRELFGAPLLVCANKV